MVGIAQFLPADRPRGRVIDRGRWRAVAQRAAALFPLTPAGLAVLVGSWAALWWGGIGHRDILLLVIGGTGVFLAGILLACTGFGAVWLGARLHGGAGAPIRGEAGFPLRTGFRLADPPLPLIDVRWSWHDPALPVELIADGWGRTERLTAPSHGEWSQVTRRVVVTDVFGLTRIAFLVKENRQLRLEPSTGKLRGLPLVSSFGAGDGFADPLGAPQGDPFDLRAYVPGDPVRWVSWKVYARTRQLVVRTPERALAPIPQTVAYLIGGPGGEASAAAARVAVESGVLGVDFELGADGTSGRCTDVEPAMDAIVHTGTLPAAASGDGLHAFVAESEGNPRVIVFAPGVDGPWVQRLLTVTAHFPHIVFEVLLCVDGVDRRPPRSWWRRALFWQPLRGPGPHPVPIDGLEGLLRRLGRAVAQVRLVDRAAGTVFQDVPLRKSA